MQKILVYTKDAEFMRKLSELISGEEISVVPLEDMAKLVQKAFDELPHAVLVECRRSNVIALEACNQLKADPIVGHIPLIMIQEVEGDQPLAENRAEVVYEGRPGEEDIAKQIKNIFANAPHELDVNPLTQFPGIRSSLGELELSFAGSVPFAICSVRMNGLDGYRRGQGLERYENLIKKIGDLTLRIAGECRSGRFFLSHPAENEFMVLLDPAAAVETAERLIECYEREILSVEFRGQRKRNPPVVLSIAIVTNEKTRFRHAGEMTRSCDEIHIYLRRFPHCAYLKDRRIELREGDKGPVPQIRAEDAPPVIRKVQKQHRPARTYEEQLREDLLFFLDNRNIMIYFQPIGRIAERRKLSRISGYEALTRFRRPNGVWVNPAKLFDAAREMELVKDLDILCALSAYQQVGDLLGGAKLFLNLNRETFLDPVAMETLYKGLSPMESSIVLEVTEQSLVRELKPLLAALKKCQKKGFQIALDDTGGGLVSLREAAQVRPNYIKFDRAIIRHIDRSEVKQKIYMSLQFFAKSIGAETIGEGVETWEEWMFLCDHKTDMGQGYYIGKPAPPEHWHLYGEFLLP